jgi:hypothetical protein
MCDVINLLFETFDTYAQAAELRLSKSTQTIYLLEHQQAAKKSKPKQRKRLVQADYATRWQFSYLQQSKPTRLGHWHRWQRG